MAKEKIIYISVTWSRMKVDFYKINSDGCSKGNLGTSVIRDNLTGNRHSLVSMMEKNPYLGCVLKGFITCGVVRVDDKVHGLKNTDDGTIKIEEEKVHEITEINGNTEVTEIIEY
ncbi:hypothetical protein BC332_23799 [Capsicum chinense]|nr:hypothetical protein BC332_23799 [Capsicum chinense]